MRNFKIVFGYELKNQLGKKSVIVTTVLIMLFVFALFNIPRLIALFSGGADEAPQQDTTLTQDVGYLFTDPALESKISSVLNLGEDNLYTSRDSLIQDVQGKKLEVGFVVNSLTDFESLWQDKDMESNQGAVLSETLKTLFVSDKLSEMNLTMADIDKLQNTQITEKETIMGKNSTNNVMLAFGMLFIVYMFVLLYGQVTSTIIAREKDSKTMELLITSCKPSALILGKVAASAVASLVQIICIVLAALVGFHLNKHLLPPTLIMMLSGTLTRSYILTYIFYSGIGYIMYLFLYAALGSTVSKVEDVGSATGFVQFIFIAGYIAASFVMNMPSSSLALITSFIPFTSLMVMPLRSALVTVPFWQHLVSGSLLLLTTVFLAFLSIKIYRWGTLNYGNKTGFFHAIKMALKSSK